MAPCRGPGNDWSSLKWQVTAISTLSSCADASDLPREDDNSSVQLQRYNVLGLSTMPCVMCRTSRDWLRATVFLACQLITQRAVFMQWILVTAHHDMI